MSPQGRKRKHETGAEGDGGDGCSPSRSFTLARFFTIIDGIHGVIMRVRHSTLRRIFVYGLRPTASAILLVSISLAEERPSAWPQWGGPNRDFKVASPALADSWPPEGPPKLWSRSLGDGYSAIVADQGVLYTMYHRSASDGAPQEAVIAVDADSGKTKWEHHYDSPFPSEFKTDYGPGPNATPLIVGSRLFTVGSIAKFHAFDLETGNVLWSCDLYHEFHLKRARYGDAPGLFVEPDCL